MVDADAAAIEVALAWAGIPLTMLRLSCPPAKADILNALRSVICGGADHIFLDALGDVEIGGGSEGEVDSEGDAVTSFVSVTTSVAVEEAPR